jgi:phosphoribosylglycinamide formyltransferase-1
VTSPRLAVLVSGSGSNLQAMLDARAAGRLAAEIAVVVSNRPGVKALERATAAGVPAEVVDHKAFAGRPDFDAALDATLRRYGVEYVSLAGFMRLLTPAFVRAWQGRLVNLHPSLLPAFPGAHAIAEALAAGVRETGVTVHFVDEGTDTGPVIAQEPVPVLPGDTEESLAARVHAVEHRLYPRALEAVCTRRVRLEGRTVLGSI